MVFFNSINVPFFTSKVTPLSFYDTVSFIYVPCFYGKGTDAAHL